MWLRVIIGQLATGLLVLSVTSVSLAMIMGHECVILIAVLSAVVLMSVTLVPIALWVLAPAHALNDTIEQIRRGDVERLAAHRCPAELRELVDCLNAMAATLQGNAFFLADVTHQLRTELQLLQIRLERLGDHVTPAGAGIHVRAMADVERLHSTLTEHLEFAKMIEASPPAEIDMGCVVLDRVRAWQDVAARRNVQIRALLGDRPVVLVRRGALEQLLDILIDNAIRYSPNSGSITVAVKSGDHHATLRLLDQGPGMSPEERDRATARGWRGDRAAGEGRGLGLAIACMLVGSNGGRLSLDAGPAGRGLDARCTFPIVRREEVF